MKRVLFLGAVLLAALCRPAAAAELKVLAPADKTVVRGKVEFRIQPVHAPMDQFLDNPYVKILDHNGEQVEEVRAPRNPQTGICSTVVDLSKLKDGQYQVEIRYRTLVGGAPQETQEDLTLGVRNSNARPSRFTVQFEDKAYRTDEAADVKVKVLDGRGKPMAGVRVTFKADQGDLTSPAEITDLDGEAFISVQSEELLTLTVTLTVEGLPPVTRTVRFAQ